MRLTQLFPALLAFMLVLIGFMSFYTGVGDAVNKEPDKSLETEDRLNELEGDINNESDPNSNEHLYGVISNLDPREDTSITQFLSASISVVPAIVNVVTGPIDVVHALIDDIADTFPWIPGYITTILKLAFDISVLLAIVGMYLRYSP